MNFEQSFAKGGKDDSRLELAQVPYKRSELLKILAERQKFVTDELAEDVAVSEDQKDRDAVFKRQRQLAKWDDELAAASKKFGEVTDEELKDPASAGQVWIKAALQKRLDEIGRAAEEKSLKEVEAYLASRDAERTGLEKEIEAKAKRGETPREVIGDEDVELELEAHDIEPLDLVKKKKKKAPADQTAYLDQLGQKLAAEEDTQVDYEDPFERLLREKSGEREIAVAGQREHLRQIAVVKAMEELEDLSVEALARVSKQWNELKGLKARLSELRAKFSGGSAVEAGVLAAVEAAVHDMTQEGEASWKDVLMIEKQIASLREELGPQGETVPPEVPELKTPVPRSRPGLKKAA